MDNCFRIQRTDTQYTDIENFKDYEFTECIVFELAVRAAKNTLIELIRLKTQPFDKENFRLDRKKIVFLEKELKERYWLSPKYFYITRNQTALPKREVLILLINKGGTHNFSQSLLYAYHYSFLLDAFPEEYKTALTISGDENNFPSLIGFGNTSNDSAEIYTLSAYTDTIEKSKRILRKKKSRPSLVIPKEHSNELLVKINPNISPKENMAFLKEALEKIYKKKTSYSMNELIKRMPNKEEDTAVETIKHKKSENKNKKFADMFFIYDYVTCILKDVISYNKEIEEKLLAPLLDGYDQIRLREDLSPYITATQIINSDEYGTQLSNQLSNKSKSTIGDDYNIIHNLIKENFYKTLI